ncbi:MAG: Tex family protein [Bacteroidetes bacterium]|jgi:uncharacterized protein|nr:Tex family protein [Bacteroidota bacterium]
MTETTHFSTQISKQLLIEHQAVRQVIKLLGEGATIPFIARYRKEMTGSLDEVQIAAIQKLLEQLEALEKRRAFILESIAAEGKLDDQLKLSIMQATTMQRLEDLYLPYKPKRRTRATIAREKGLEPLAAVIMKQEITDLDKLLPTFVKPEKAVNNSSEALAGALDIIAEWMAENPTARERIRKLYHQQAQISATVVKDKLEEAKTYSNYFDWNEQLPKAPSHRLLALFRAEQEGLLKVKVTVEGEEALARLSSLFVKRQSTTAELCDQALKDSYKRLIAPSIENEVRAFYKEKADAKAIEVFAENLRQLLLTPPLGGKKVLAIDPGFRTGCKVVILDRQGQLMHNDTIYPHPPQRESKQAIQKINNLVNAHQVEVIAIGNGTAGRETEDLVRSIRFDRDLMAVMVNESGASVYSASKVARDEFPDYDITVRGAVSIGRRLMDPLAELVKIDPKSIGVGQYQHDVNQKALQDSLSLTVESCVNSVGVELNTASEQLLSYVSGLGPQLAATIIRYRNENGAFKERKELLRVPRLGQKAFEQSAGFLRIRQSKNPLDASGVHPESYYIVENIAKSLKRPIAELIGNSSLIKTVDPKSFTDKQAGIETLTDILAELEKPGRDPRASFETVSFSKDIRKISDLKEGMQLTGIVTNITAFGAFVDIGVHQDGLVHISELADRFVKDPNEVVQLNQKVMVRILAVDEERKRITLSMKAVLQHT